MYGRGERDYGVEAVTFHPNGSEIASYGYDRAVRIWAVDSGNRIAELPGFPEPGLNPASLSFTPDGTRLLAASRTDVRVWDTATYGGTILRRRPPKMSSRAFPASADDAYDRLNLAFGVAPNNTRIAEGVGDGIEIWDAAAGSVIARWKADPGVPWRHIAFNANGDRVAVPFFSEGKDLVTVRDALSGARLATLAGHQGSITAVAFSPDGSLIATGDEYGSVRLWNALTGHMIASIFAGSVSSLTFSSDGRSILSGLGPWTAVKSYGGGVLLWHPLDGVPARRFETSAVVGTAFFNPDGNQVLALLKGEGQIVVWDAPSGKLLGTLKTMGQEDLCCAVFSPDGTRIVAASSTALYVWDASNHELLLTIASDILIRKLAFSPDSTRLFAASVDGEVRILDSRFAHSVPTR
jgi:WD40 repeat protein